MTFDLTGCSGGSTRVSIVPPSATPTFDNGIVLTCTVEAPRAYGVKPYWFIVRSNGTRDMVSQWPRPFYAEDRCSWWAELRVKSVDSGARYVCQYGTEEASVKLEGESGEHYVVVVDPTSLILANCHFR